METTLRQDAFLVAKYLESYDHPPVTEIFNQFHSDSCMVTANRYFKVRSLQAEAASTFAANTLVCRLPHAATMSVRFAYPSACHLLSMLILFNSLLLTLPLLLRQIGFKGYLPQNCYFARFCGIEVIDCGEIRT